MVNSGPSLMRESVSRNDRYSVATDTSSSYTGADVAWAQWIAVELEAAGYTTLSQALDFRPGQLANIL